MKITIPVVTWALGDAEQETTSGVTVSTRPLYYTRPSDGQRVRVGEINPDYAEPLMAALNLSRGHD